MRFVFISIVIALATARADQTGAPAWAAEAIFYQIFPERFCNGDQKNDPTRESLEFPITPGPTGASHPGRPIGIRAMNGRRRLAPIFTRMAFSIGVTAETFRGSSNKLDYLSDLGINAIYFNPLFYSRSLHKYDGNSYHHIDPYFGPDPEGDFKLMAKETADPENVAMDRGGQTVSRAFEAGARARDARHHRRCF